MRMINSFVYKAGTYLISRHYILRDDIDKTMFFIVKFKLKLGIILLKNFINNNPNSWNAFWLIGKAYQRLNQHEIAYNNFILSANINPTHSDVLRELGGQSLVLGKLDEGEYYCKKAFESNPNDATLQSNLALVLAIKGDFHNAVLEAKSALIRDPNNQIIKNTLEYIQSIADGSVQKPDRIEIS